MGRLDFGAGRFSADYETNDIAESLRGWQTEFGDQILYYRFWMEESTQSNIWGEAGGSRGRIWHPPDTVEVLHATHVEGSMENRDQGAYYNDDLYVTASFDQLRRLGMTEMDLQHQSYLRDRIVYDFRVFRVTRIQVMGQIQRRDVVVSIEGAQVKPDEMLNDPGFEHFANPTFPRKP
jgi:hypothetical protein